MADKTNFNEAISLLKKNAEQNGSDIWVPSLNKSVKFKPLTTLHHKKFVKILIDSSIFNNALNLHIYDVISQTCIDPINIDDLTVYDRIAICLGLRTVNFKKNYKLIVGENEEKEIDLNLLLQSAKEKYSNISLNNKSIKVGDIVVEVGLPNLKKEKEFDSYIFNKYLVNYDKTNQEQTNQIFADLMLFSAVTYIQSIAVGENIVKFDDLKIHEKIEIISNLNRSIFDPISEFILECNNQKTSLFSIEVTNTNNENQNIEISVDAGFFVDE